MHIKWEWTVPNVLSLIRLVLIPVFVVFYQMSAQNQVWLYWAVGVLVLSGLSDFFDGIIARRFNQISEAGKLLDPVADKLTQIAVILCVTLRHPELIWLLVLCVVKESLQAIGGVLLFSRRTEVEGSHWYGKLATGLFYFTMTFIVVTDHWFTQYKTVTDGITTVLLIVLILCMLMAFFGYLRVFIRLKKKPSEKSDSAEAKEE